MKKALLCIAACLLIASCSVSPEMPYEKDGVSFTVPQGWEITEEEDIDNGKGYTVSCEKQGFTESGLVGISWVNDIVEEDAFIEAIKEVYKENWLLQHIKPVFSPTEEGSFNDITCSVCSYKVSILGILNTGTIYCFTSDTKTICLLIQEAKEDAVKNKPGIEKIKESFAAK